MTRREKEQDMEIGESSKSLKFLALTLKAVQHECIPLPAAQATLLPDGSTVVLNSKGDIVYARFENGVTQTRHDGTVLCTTASGDHWFCSRYNAWSKLD